MAKSLRRKLNATRTVIVTPKLAGYQTFTSHYHIEHTLDFLNRQTQQKTNGVPRGLETPGFVTKFKEAGVNIVHLAEFHQGWTPGQKTPERLKMLKTMFQECERLSDKQFLLLPGEEPNVHLGGHWIALFPRSRFILGAEPLALRTIR